jgi:hypothetical protein
MELDRTILSSRNGLVTGLVLAEWMQIMKRKKLEETIGADTEALKRDFRNLRDDLVGFMRSRRRRGSAEAGAQVRETATEVRERPARRGEYPEPPRRWNPVSAVRERSTRRRRLAALAALGVAAYLLLRKREVVGAESAEPRRAWRTRLPWTAKSRRAAVQTATHEPAAGATPPEGSAVTAVREEASVEESQQVTSF